MNHIIHIVLTVVVPAFLLVEPVLGQQQFQLPADNVQKTVLLEEVDAILADHDDSITVKTILGKKEQTDLKKGDIIFMAQGEPVASISDLMKLYEKAKENGTFKMAVKRGEERFLTSFEIDPTASSGRDMFSGNVTFNLDDASTSTANNLNIVPELMVYGIVAAGDDSGLIIKKTIPNLNAQLKQKGISEGDYLIALNNVEINTHKEFRDIWNDISEGEKIELKFRKDGKDISLSLSKINVNGKVIFKTEG